MIATDRSEARLYTHIEDGGLYWFRGVSKGTGANRNQELHVYSDYFTGATYHRTHEDWSNRMVPAKARYLKFVNKVFATAKLFFYSLVVVATLVGLRWFSTDEVPTKPVIDLLGVLLGGTLTGILVRIPIVFLHWKDWKKGWTT